MPNADRQTISKLATRIERGDVDHIKQMGFSESQVKGMFNEYSQILRGVGITPPKQWQDMGQARGKIYINRRPHAKSKE